MKVLTLLGTRPEIIRLSQIIPKLDNQCDHVLVHTGQNYDPQLSDIFFTELELRQPDHYFGIKASNFSEQIANILVKSEDILLKERPDALLVLGDTNSALAAFIAKRMGIPVFHMEAGNRCYDDRVPEEVNRRIIDHCSDILMPYTERSRKNLLREGIRNDRIYVTGNPIFEVIKSYEPHVSKSKVLNGLGLEPQGYFLVTMHRSENVDVQERLYGLVTALEKIHEIYEMPIIVSTHPRTRNRMETFNINKKTDQIKFLPPFGFFEFISLEKNAFCVLSDSGTVQEECCIMRIPNVTVRDVTERPETIECGSNILSGTNPESILRCVQCVINQNTEWRIPEEYLAENVSNSILKIIMGEYPLLFQKWSL